MRKSLKMNTSTQKRHIARLMMRDCDKSRRCCNAINTHTYTTLASTEANFLEDLHKVVTHKWRLRTWIINVWQLIRSDISSFTKMDSRWVAYAAFMQRRWAEQGHIVRNSYVTLDFVVGKGSKWSFRVSRCVCIYICMKIFVYKWRFDRGFVGCVMNVANSCVYIEWFWGRKWQRCRGRFGGVQMKNKAVVWWLRIWTLLLVAWCKFNKMSFLPTFMAIIIIIWWPIKIWLTTDHPQ